MMQDTPLRPLLIFGRHGQIATELAHRCDAVFIDRETADLCHAGDCADAVLRAAPALVINAAAYTQVDAAETDAATAFRINAEAPAAMAQACRQIGAAFVHFSTDYVFDGTGDRPWRPDDEPNPINVYGRSKLAGEQAIEAVGGRWAVLRTSWIFSLHGRNFVRTMVRLGEERREVRVVADQIGGPTWAGDAAYAALRLGRALHAGVASCGIYHLAGAPDASWAELARAVFQQAGLPTSVVDITAAEYATRARRPQNSRLDCSDMERLGFARPDWRRALATVVSELRTNP